MAVTNYVDFRNCSELEIELALNGERFDAVEVIANSRDERTGQLVGVTELGSTVEYTPSAEESFADIAA